MKNKTYDMLKWVALIALPVFSTLIGSLGEIWGFQYSEQIVLTVNAIGIALGGLLQYSSNNYNKEQKYCISSSRRGLVSTSAYAIYLAFSKGTVSDLAQSKAILKRIDEQNYPTGGQQFP